MPARCPRCGRFRRARQFLPEPQVQPVCATLSPLDRCVPPDTIPEELYAGIEPQTVLTRCCDSLCGCQNYDLSTRNSFWPSFCHPRWLPCELLYRRF